MSRHKYPDGMLNTSFPVSRFGQKKHLFSYLGPKITRATTVSSRCLCVLYMKVVIVRIVWVSYYKDVNGPRTERFNGEINFIILISKTGVSLHTIILGVGISSNS